MTFAASPIRYPDAGSVQVMTRRGWWLTVLNLLIPGSAQVLAGNRKLGRFGLGMTLTLWVAVAVAFVVYLLWPTIIFAVATSSLGLTAVQVVLAAYAILWVVLTLDTLRLVRLVRAGPGARAGIAAFAVLVLFALSGTAAYGAYVAGSARGAFSGIFAQGPSQQPVDGRYNILLLGGDAGPDRDGLRPDSISVVSVDADSGQAVTIGLPRDLTNVPFPAGSPLAAKYPDGYGYHDNCDVDVCELNSIYTEVELRSPQMYPEATKHNSQPGIEAMRDAAEGVLGIKIQYFVLLDMQGFSDLIDALGGVDVKVTERVPIGGDENLNNVGEWIEPGMRHLDGYHAQWYARSRHGAATGDYDRMARQRQLEEAILKQINPANVVTKFDAIAKAGTQVIKTDIPQQMLGYFVDLGMKTKTLPVKRVELVPPEVDPSDPDYASIRKMVKQALSPSTGEPTP
ncbi:MAG: LCP family protein [Microbacteriaceae bacterium]